jgi:erythromycin esterase-like protein
VFGIDNITGGNSFIADYLLKLSTSRQDSTYYLHAINRHQYQEVKEYILKSGIPAFLEKRDLKYLLFLLDEMAHAHSMADSDYGAERDSNMAKRVEQIIESYLSPTEKAVVLAHSHHINKDISITDYVSDNYRAGYYLHEKYDKQYYTITFQVGEGSHRQDSTLAGSYIVDAPLKSPFPFAFEQAGLNTDKSYFYYSSNQLPSGVLGLNMIFRESRNKEPFLFCNIPLHFDALVFIRQGNASQHIEKSPVGYFMATISLLDRRLMLLRRELKE